MSKLLPILAAASGIAAAAPAAPVTSARQLYGHWQVVGVAVADAGVQALSADDPSYMGRRLTFTAARLAWDKPGRTSTEAPCTRPAIRPVPRDDDPDARATVRKVGGPALRAFAIACASGSWGPNAAPSAAILALRDGTIALWWYDNGLLKLRRVD